MNPNPLNLNSHTLARTNNKIQVAVYLVDASFFENYTFDETVETVIRKANEGTEPLFRYREETVTEPGNAYRIRLYYNYKQRRPRWAPFLSGILTADAVLGSVQNTTHSFICFIGYEEQVFAITGGSGNLAIDRFVIRILEWKLSCGSFSGNTKW